MAEWSDVTTLTAATPVAMELQVNGVPPAPTKLLVRTDAGTDTAR